MSRGVQVQRAPADQALPLAAGQLRATEEFPCQERVEPVGRFLDGLAHADGVDGGPHGAAVEGAGLAEGDVLPCAQRPAGEVLRDRRGALPHRLGTRGVAEHGRQPGAHLAEVRFFQRVLPEVPFADEGGGWWGTRRCGALGRGGGQGHLLPSLRSAPCLDGPAVPGSTRGRANRTRSIPVAAGARDPRVPHGRQRCCGASGPAVSGRNADACCRCDRGVAQVEVGDEGTGRGPGPHPDCLGRRMRPEGPAHPRARLRVGEGDA